MPLVRVQYNPDAVKLQSFMIHHSNFREMLASVLSCTDPGGHLEATDLEVYYVESGQQPCSEFDIVVDIEAMDFPSRVVRKDVCAEVIRDAVAIMFRRRRVAIWLKLVNAAWASSGE